MDDRDGKGERKGFLVKRGHRHGLIMGGRGRGEEDREDGHEPPRPPSSPSSTHFHP